MEFRLARELDREKIEKIYEDGSLKLKSLGIDQWQGPEKPNLNNLILSDRSFISGISYALTNDKNLNIDELISLNKFALNGHFGDKFIFLKADENTLKNRLFNKKLDNIEKRGIKYLLTVQENMEMILNYLKFEVLKINASDEISNIHAKIKEFIK